MATSTADQLTGRAIGALFFAAFGGAWLALWLAATQRLIAATAGALGAGVLALGLAGEWVLRRARRLPVPLPTPTDAAQARREWRVFGAVNVGQWGAIFLAGGLLPRLGFALYLTPAIVLIVGLHFFPLAQLFRYGGHYLTGGALLAWALGCMVLVPPPAWQARVALGAGIILWLSAGYTLGRAAQALRPQPLR